MNLNKSREFFDPELLDAPIHIIGCGAVGSTIAENLRGTKVYYYRFWASDNNYLHIDYGSHSDFFIIDAKIMAEPETNAYEEGQIVELDNGQLMFYWQDTLDDETRNKIKK